MQVTCATIRAVMQWAIENNVLVDAAQRMLDLQQLPSNLRIEQRADIVDSQAQLLRDLATGDAE